MPILRAHPRATTSLTAPFPPSFSLSLSLSKPSFLIMLPLSWWSTSPPDLAEPSQTLPAVVSVLLSFALYLGLNLLFLGALAAADKLEDPFPRLPLADIVDTTRRDVARVAEQVEGMQKLAGSGSCKEA